MSHGKIAIGALLLGSAMALSLDGVRTGACEGARRKRGAASAALAGAEAACVEAAPRISAGGGLHLGGGGLHLGGGGLHLRWGSILAGCASEECILAGCTSATPRMSAVSVMGYRGRISAPRIWRGPEPAGLRIRELPTNRRFAALARHCMPAARPPKLWAYAANRRPPA